MNSTPGILNVILRRRPVAAVVAAVADAMDSNETLEQKDLVMSTVAPIVPTAPVTPAAAAPTAPAPDVLAKIGGEPATLEQLESAFVGETEFVLASLREKRTMAQAQGAYIAVLKDRNAKLSASVAEKDNAIKGLGTDGFGITNPPAAVVDAGAESGTSFKTYDAAVAHYQKAGDKQPYRTAATKHPALHLAWRAEQGQKNAQANEARELKRRGVSE